VIQRGIELVIQSPPHPHRYLLPEIDPLFAGDPTPYPQGGPLENDFDFSGLGLALKRSNNNTTALSFNGILKSVSGVDGGYYKKQGFGIHTHGTSGPSVLSLVSQIGKCTPR